jgi:CheY-like chemotaxis protein
MSFIWLSIEPSGTRWAITHNSGILGYVKTEAEAWSLVENLAGLSQQALSDAGKRPKRYRRLPKSIGATPKSVLIVKNDARVCLELASQLAEMGLKVLAANDADQAILILDGDPEIELLIIDIELPRGSIDGVRFAHLVNRRWPSLKIIAMSELNDIGLSDLPIGSMLLAEPSGLEVMMDAVAHMIYGRATPSGPTASSCLLAA